MGNLIFTKAFAYPCHDAAIELRFETKWNETFLYQYNCFVAPFKWNSLGYKSTIVVLSSMNVRTCMLCYFIEWCVCGNWIISIIFYHFISYHFNFKIGFTRNKDNSETLVYVFFVLFFVKSIYLFIIICKYNNHWCQNLLYFLLHSHLSIRNL